MANKFVTFLQTVGKDVEKGIEKAAPFLTAAAQVLVPVVAPQFAPLFATVSGIVIQTEQKYAALGQQGGTGAQKLAEATTIASPVIMEILQLAGKTDVSATVQNYINAVVQFLNAVPAGVASPSSSPAPVAPSA